MLLTITEYGNNVSLGDWASFFTIAAQLIFIGFALRSIIILRTAITGEGNVIGSFIKLIASVVGIFLIRAFL